MSVSGLHLTAKEENLGSPRDVIVPPVGFGSGRNKGNDEARVVVCDFSTGLGNPRGLLFYGRTKKDASVPRNVEAPISATECPPCTDLRNSVSGRRREGIEVKGAEEAVEGFDEVFWRKECGRGLEDRKTGEAGALSYKPGINLETIERGGENLKAPPSLELKGRDRRLRNSEFMREFLPTQMLETSDRDNLVTQEHSVAAVAETDEKPEGLKDPQKGRDATAASLQIR